MQMWFVALDEHIDVVRNVSTWHVPHDLISRLGSKRLSEPKTLMLAAGSLLDSEPALDVVRPSPVRVPDEVDSCSEEDDYTDDDDEEESDSLDDDDDDVDDDDDELDDNECDTRHLLAPGGFTIYLDTPLRAAYQGPNDTNIADESDDDEDDFPGRRWVLGGDVDPQRALPQQHADD